MMEGLIERLADNLLSIAILVTWVGLERKEKHALQDKFDDLVQWIKTIRTP
jgi:hypothetical protein